MRDDRAAELRTRFDRGFAEPPEPEAPPTYDYLRIRLGGEPFALVLSEISSLHADLDVVSVPSPARELIGIAAVRSVLVPIYDLRLAIGAAATLPARWTVLVRGGTAGFSFDGFDGHARTIVRVRATEAGVRPLVTLAEQSHPIIGMETVLEKIQGAMTKESR